MTDATPVPDARVPSSTNARRRMLAAGAVAAVLVAAGGVAAGVAAAVSRGTPTPQATGGATLYLPTIGGGGGGSVSGGSVSGGSVSGGAPAMAAGGTAAAPQAALSFAAGQGGPAMSSTIAYPYPGNWCNGPATAAATGPGITATGLAQVTLPSTAQTTQVLSVGVQSNGSGQDVATALADAQQRLSAIRDALHTSGVPDGQITQQGLNVYANGAPKPSNVNVNGSLSATIADPAVLDRAMRAVVAAGASNLNVWSNNGAGTAPDDKSLQSAIARATDAAKTMAQSQAQAAGVALGTLQSSQAQPPSICGWSPGGAQMVVAVTLTYAIR